MVENLRRVRSYVIRAARMSEAQKKALENLAPGRVLPVSTAELDWRKLFPTAEKCLVEIGFGMGYATRTVASEHPMWGILGIEVHPPGVGKLLWYMDQMNLENIRIVQHDAVEVLDQMIAADTVDGFHIWFPDPWPKKRHHKRRLIQSPFAEQMLRCLKPGGYVHAATDWEPYAEHIMDVLTETDGLKNRFDRWAPKPDYRPDTKFETRGLAADRVIRDIIFEKE